MISNSGVIKMETMKCGPVKVGYGFECVKNNGKEYAGRIVKIGAYARGTLVTIEYHEADGYHDSENHWYDVLSPVYRAVYLEDCKDWTTTDYHNA